MPRPSIRIILNAGNVDAKRTLTQRINTLPAGTYKVNIKPTRIARSNRQNAYYWAVVVEYFYQFLIQQDYEVGDPEQAHELLKAKFLGKALRNKAGEKIAVRVRSTTELSVAEFYEYCEKCRTWLADFFHIATPDPSEYGCEVPAVVSK